jgi:hypothetical protein
VGRLRRPGLANVAARRPARLFVAHVSGEGHGPGLSSLVDELVAEHGDALRRGPLFSGAPADALPDDPSALRFPAKAVTLPAGASLVSESGHHRLVELEPDLVGVRRIIGAGRGLRDGAAATALFAEPLAARGAPRLWSPLPSGTTSWSAWWEEQVVVAMAGCHQLWSFDPLRSTVAVIAGTGDEGLRDGAPHEVFFAQPNTSMLDLPLRPVG